MFSHNDISAGVQESQQFADALKQFLPMFGLHGVADFRVVIEDGRNDGELELNSHSHAKIVGFRDLVQLVKHFDLFPSISSCW